MKKMTFQELLGWLEKNGFSKAIERRLNRFWLPNGTYVSVDTTDDKNIVGISYSENKGCWRVPIRDINGLRELKRVIKESITPSDIMLERQVERFMPNQPNLRYEKVETMEHFPTENENVKQVKKVLHYSIFTREGKKLGEVFWSGYRLLGSLGPWLVHQPLENIGELQNYLKSLASRA